jgi:alpha/beta superfamily hydrolase
MSARDVTLNVGGIKLWARLYSPAVKPPHPVICICHGIPAVNATLVERGYPLMAEQISTELGVGVFIFSFRGCGESEGNFDITGWREDLATVLDYLSGMPQVDKNRIAVFGFSGGAAVSCCLSATDRRATALVLAACPADFSMMTDAPNQAEEMVAHFRQMGIIRDSSFPSSAEDWLNGFRQTKPVDSIGDVSCPLLILHASADETVPLVHAQRLHKAAKEPKELIVIPDGAHRLRHDEAAMKAALKWLAKHGYRTAKE